MFRHFDNGMELFIIENFRDTYPGSKGRELTELLVRDILSEKGISDAVIMRTEKGKPYIDESFGVFFSVSHSGRYFVCLVGDAPVGVDVQEETRANIDAVSRRYFTEEEAGMVKDGGSDQFFRIWARKEAYGKYLGSGLAGVLNKVSVTDREDVEFTEFQLEKGMYCACCTKRQR